MTIDGLPETASARKDQFRMDTRDESFKMDADEALGVTLGRWLHKNVTARVARTVTWHDSGKETKAYKLLSIAEQQTLTTPDEASPENDIPF